MAWVLVMFIYFLPPPGHFLSDRREASSLYPLGALFCDAQPRTAAGAFKRFGTKALPSGAQLALLAAIQRVSMSSAILSPSAQAVVDTATTDEAHILEVTTTTTTATATTKLRASAAKLGLLEVEGETELELSARHAALHSSARLTHLVPLL